MEQYIREQQISTIGIWIGNVGYDAHEAHIRGARQKNENKFMIIHR